VRKAHGCVLVHYNKRARFFHLTTLLYLRPWISPPPPLLCSSFQFDGVPLGRPLLSMSSLFQKHPVLRPKISKNRLFVTWSPFPPSPRPSNVDHVEPSAVPSAWSPLFMSVHTFRPLLISFLFFDSLALPLPNQNTTTSDLPTRTSLIVSRGKIFTWECFSCSATTDCAMGNWIPQLDLAHEIGLEIPLVNFLIVGWWCFIDGWKYWPEFFALNVYDCYSTTKSAIDKWVVQMDSAHQRGPETTFQEVLIVVQSGGGVGGQKYSGSSKIAADFHCSATTRWAMDKWRWQRDSAHQTGLGFIFFKKFWL